MKNCKLQNNSCKFLDMILHTSVETSFKRKYSLKFYFSLKKKKTQNVHIYIYIYKTSWWTIKPPFSLPSKYD